MFHQNGLDPALGDDAVIIQDRPEEAVLAAVDVIIDLITYGRFYLFKGHEPLVHCYCAEPLAVVPGDRRSGFSTLRKDYFASLVKKLLIREDRITAILR